MQSTDKYLVVTHPVLLSQPALSKRTYRRTPAIWLLYEFTLFKSSKGYCSCTSDPSVFQLCVAEQCAGRVFAVYSVGFSTSTCISLCVLHLLAGNKDPLQWLRGKIL